jgi:signal transduction histidine kinase
MLLEAQSEACIDGIQVISPDSRIVNVNRRFIELWGIPEELVDSGSDEAALKWALDQLVEPEEFLERVRYLYAHPEEESRDEIRLKDGRVFDRYSASVTGPEGVSYGRVWYFRDITERIRLYAQTEQRRRELEALYRADETLYRSLRVDDVLQALVDVAADVLRADKTSVAAWDAARERLETRAARGLGALSLAAASYAPGEGITGHVAVTGQTIVLEDIDTDPRVKHLVTDPEGIRSLIHAPILVDGQVFGVFEVYFCQPRTFSGEDERLVQALAQRAALAIENARLYEQAQQAAMIEERQRLARELHDSVTQTLFSSSIIAEVLPRLWERDPALALPRLEELRQSTRGALAEMRTLLLELRPAALTEVALPELLRQLTEAITGRARLSVSLEVEGERALPPDVQVALYRIAQEALNNVAKHASAGEAWVHLRLAPERVELRVSDDGRGFDPAAVAPGRLGLGGMRERAEAIGATLRVEAHPGGGTEIDVAWSPVAHGGRA